MLQTEPPPQPVGPWRGGTVGRKRRGEVTPDAELVPSFPPGTPWRPDFTPAEWDLWMRGAGASDLRAFNAWGLKVLSALEPIGFPARPVAPEPRMVLKVDYPLATRPPAPPPAPTIDDLPTELGGAVLRAVRIARGLSQADAAKRAGLVRSVVQAIEVDRRVSLDSRRALAAVYELLPVIEPNRCLVCGAVLDQPRHWRVAKACGGVCSRRSWSGEMRRRRAAA